MSKKRWRREERRRVRYAKERELTHCSQINARRRHQDGGSGVTDPALLEHLRQQDTNKYSSSNVRTKP